MTNEVYIEFFLLCSKYSRFVWSSPVLQYARAITGALNSHCEVALALLLVMAS